ncbi:sulfite exporter TauE/SafE family protein [Limnoglobus roseus]|uniref:Probable membrane transporter protein n=1 Tax=Limnoglobus roseus TaxID=2598579 RepID=A0A5C1A583_9BACT|nr:sulfite exporter TauE/SafE family protein [Limnoglobus roseus]QEL13176.1 sulfite exporter TauE/SafE family protein [Limnoglobus roseus]
MPEVVTYLLLAGSAFLAGAINSVAGGGTLLTFPTLLGTGIADTVANATSTLALFPGSFAGSWAYRRELRSVRKFVLRMLPVSVVGGLIGSLLLVWFPSAFKVIVPWLILTAAVLFLIQPTLNRYVRMHQGEHGKVSTSVTVGVMAFQFLVAVYGGYFGAGIGILMLTALSFMHVGDIHHMNAVKTFLAAMINFVSVIVFIVDDLIRWDYAAVMCVSAIVGGYLGAHFGRKLPAVYIRWTVIVIGFGLAAYYFAKQ